ncbi:MAG: hypothetical protein GY843_15135 [Neptuniibacter sp.]|nr:hypothetical protein [Neptuniibacter sp.]
MDIHEDITAPDLWRGGVYAFDGEAWVLQLNRAPRVVSMRQARLALLAEGLLDGVNAAITDPAQVIEWEYATEVKRDDDLVSAIAGGLSMTDDQVAGLFLKASMY